MTTSGKRESIPEYCPPLYREIIDLSWHQLPAKRPKWSWILHQLEKLIQTEIDTLLNQKKEARKSTSLVTNAVTKFLRKKSCEVNSIPFYGLEDILYDDNLFQQLSIFLKKNEEEDLLNLYKELFEFRQQNFKEMDEYTSRVKQIAQRYLTNENNPLFSITKILFDELNKENIIPKHILDQLWTDLVEFLSNRWVDCCKKVEPKKDNVNTHIRTTSKKTQKKTKRDKKLFF